MLGEEPRRAHLDQSRVEVDVVGHDDGPDDPHRLSQLDGPAALAVRKEHPPQKLRLVRSHRHVLRDRKEPLHRSGGSAGAPGAVDLGFLPRRTSRRTARYYPRCCSSKQPTPPPQ